MKAVDSVVKGGGAIRLLYLCNFLLMGFPERPASATALFENILSLLSGGAGSEVWNRVYMIAPVKKFGRVRLSTNFP